MANGVARRASGNRWPPIAGIVATSTAIVKRGAAAPTRSLSAWATDSTRLWRVGRPPHWDSTSRQVRAVGALGPDLPTPPGHVRDGGAWMRLRAYPAPV